MNRSAKNVIPCAIVPALCAAPAVGALITDRSFFTGISHTLIDFESFGDGTPITLEILPFSTRFVLSDDEYVSKGALFSSSHEMGLARPSNSSTQQILSEGGSPTIFAGVLSGDDTDVQFEILFGSTAFSVGFLLLTDENFPRPMFEALDSTGNVLGSFGLNEQTLDGHIGFEDFGFMGFSSETPISRIRLSNGAFGWGIDDLMFSSVPTPGPVLTLLAAGAVMAPRRRW